MKLVVFVFPVLLAAQPTIAPTNITVPIGSTQQFTSTAMNPAWTLSSPVVGVGRIDPKTGLYTAPATLPSAPSPITVTIRVFELIPPYPHADATVTLVASPPSTSCACKDGKDGATAGDIFILSDRSATSATFARVSDGTWTASAQITGSFLALVQIYRNGARVAEKDVVSLTLSGGRIVLATKDTWPAGDVVTGTWVVIAK